MTRQKRLRLTIPTLLSALLMTFAAPPVAFSAPTAPTPANPSSLTDRIHEIGAPLRGVNIRGASYGTWHDGRSVIYTPSFGEPAVLSVVDAETGDLVSAHDLTGKTTAIYSAVAPDGTVYVAAQTPGANLFRYDPATDTMTDLGAPVPGETNIGRIDVAPDGTVWFGTFPSGLLVSYSPATGDFTSHGAVADGESYGRAVAHDGDRTLYVGTGTHALLYARDDVTGEQTPIPLPADYQDETFVNELYVRGDLVFAFMSPAHTWLVYDSATGTWLPPITSGAAAGLTHPIDGEVFLVRSDSRNLWQFDLTTHELTETSFNTGKIGYNDARAIGTATFTDPAWPGGTVVGVGLTGRLWQWNATTGEVRWLQSEANGGALKIAAMGFAPDGKLYTAGFLTPNVMARISPDDTIESLRGPSQAEVVTSLTTPARGTKLYLGSYTDAGLWEYDPDGAPWSYGTNPRRLVRLDTYDQERVLAVAAAGQRIAVGTTGEKGVAAGGLSLYDPRDGSVRFEGAPVADQSVSALATVSVDGTPVLVGGTSSHQLGVEPADPDARIFLWSLRDNAKTWQSVPVPGATSINALVPMPDGTVWGLASNTTIFSFDPATRTVTHEIDIFGDQRFGGNWAGPKLTWLDEETLVGNAAGKVFLVDVESRAVTVLADGSYATPAPGGSAVYFADATRAFRMDVTEDLTLSGITINDQDLTGFDPLVTDYDVALHHGTRKAEIQATATDPLATVRVKESDTIPGTATITVTGWRGNTATTTVNLTYRSGTTASPNP